MADLGILYAIAYCNARHIMHSIYSLIFFISILILDLRLLMNDYDCILNHIDLYHDVHFGTSFTSSNPRPKCPTLTPCSYMYKCIELLHYHYSGRQSAINENHLVVATLSQSMLSSVHVDKAVLTVGHPSRFGQASTLKLLVNS